MNGSRIVRKLDSESWVSMPWLMNIRRKTKSPMNSLGFIYSAMLNATSNPASNSSELK